MQTKILEAVCDVLELIKKGPVRNLTDHINTIDPTGNIKFTFEEEEDKHPRLNIGKCKATFIAGDVS